MNIPFREGEGSSGRFREAWEKEVFPKLKAFGPELILMSMGFDAAREDPLGEMELEAEDYWWLTRGVMEVAGGREGEGEGEGRKCKVVSVLEGGYHLGALGLCGVAHVKGLLGLPFGEGGEQGGEEEEPLEAYLLPPVMDREEEELLERMAGVTLEGGKEGGKEREM